jgi:hypothetical protein
MPYTSRTQTLARTATLRALRGVSFEDALDDIDRT